MSQETEYMRRLLIEALHGHQMAWSALECRASQIVLFGSRAAGVARIDSDWDLLCIGDGRSVYNDKIDLVWISAMQLATDRWLGSELASHVAVYGQWLVGKDSWSHRVSIAPETIRHKCQSILLQLFQLRRLWSNIVPGWRAKHLRRLRRDVQRLHYLIAKRAVPPTRILDDLWNQSGMPLEELEFLLKEALRSTNQQ